MNKSFTRRLAGKIARSPLLHRGRSLWEQNEKNWKLPLTKPEKILTGAYLILAHYSEGRFPPTFADQQKVYETERSLRTRAGMADEEARDQGRRKPFWYNHLGCMYFRHFAIIVESLQKLGINPPAKILEIGCGGGWASNFLAQMHFEIVGTTINPRDVEDAELHARAYRDRGLATKAQFITAPMEEVHQATAHLGPFDAALVYEALHHAYDWRIACREVYKSLKPGGWFLMCNEPNLVHTFVSYRYSLMSHSPEIGFRKAEIFSFLKECGFGKRVVLAKRFGFYARPFWVAAQRPPL
jgi:2-polyprenyl-3-methyl-5-hydroxy-6-metoxy-1,4-benzoquinol methylase